LFGFFYMKGSVLVDRKSDASRRKSYEEMKKTLRDGMHMGIYPEGTRNRTSDPLKKFHDGAFKLSIDTGNEIIPSVIFNTKKALPLNKFFYFWPAKLEIHFLKPVSPVNKTSEQLKVEVFEVMKDFFINHQ